MRKNLNKLATLALSGMMVMSMAVPAFAFPANELTIPFTKKLYVDGETLAPQTAFDFTIEAGPGNTEWEYETATGKSKVTTKAGLAGGVKVKEKAVFAPDPDSTEKFGKKEANSDHRYFASDAKFEVVDSVFAPATVDYGTYEYILKEVNSGYEGVVYSKSEYKIMVMKYHAVDPVDNVDKDHIIAKVVRTKLGNTINLTEEQKKKALSEKVTGITNNYGNPTPPPNPDIPPVTPPGDEDHPNDSTHVVTIKKKVTGNASNKSQDFEFEVFVVPASVTAVTDSKREMYAVLDEDGATALSGKAITASTQAEYAVRTAAYKFTFKAKDGKGIKITGLTKGDKVYVKEVNGAGYVMTAGEDKTNYATTGDLTTGTRLDELAAVTNYETSFNVHKNQAAVEIKNDKDNVTPTGIVMNVAPYALMLAVAGGLGVVFVNRKKEEE